MGISSFFNFALTWQIDFVLVLGERSALGGVREEEVQQGMALHLVLKCL